MACFISSHNNSPIIENCQIPVNDGSDSGWVISVLNINTRPPDSVTDKLCPQGKRRQGGHWILSNFIRSTGYRAD